MTTATDPLAPGMDFRDPEVRREVFLRFYEFHLRYRAHPGGVYYLLPFLRARLGWDTEEALWYAFLNGNTQHPVTSLLLHRAAPTPDAAPAAVEFWEQNYERLAWDTDRRYHKKAFRESVASYLDALAGRSQLDHWMRLAAGGWPAMWAAASGLHSFGRLSAFSYLEYLRIMGIPFDCDDLMLGDRSGSRSHRNGLCKVLGLDSHDWHDSNPAFDGRYSPELIDHLTRESWGLLAEMRRRAFTGPDIHGASVPVGDVSLFTLESALCTYKSWHRPNRRYPNVYNDLLYDRLVKAAESWPADVLGVFWEARQECLPLPLRLEDNPYDPGCVPAKQNHYLNTGEVIVMDLDWPCFRNGFAAAVRAGEFGRCR